MVPRETKEQLLGQKGVVLWFTGEGPGSQPRTQPACRCCSSLRSFCSPQKREACRLVSLPVEGLSLRVCQAITRPAGPPPKLPAQD